MTFGIEKWCADCQAMRPIVEFYRRGTGHYDTYCKQHALARSRAYLQRRYREDSEFREKAKARAKAWRGPNKARANARARERYATEPEFREKRRQRAAQSPTPHADHHRSSRYEMSREKFDELIAAQGGACAVCRQPFSQTPRIDHDHETGIVRGLLCDWCNRGLGYFKDRPEVLRSAAEYLERRGKQTVA